MKTNTSIKVLSDEDYAYLKSSERFRINKSDREGKKHSRTIAKVRYPQPVRIY